ncbi:hypothetical protein BD289DRAFT_438361 [Coniella lustricola]|uniref:Uncharacterized protein n=1 Tax=Coniella lustricola TaxID=2025994 RepID=A0A2T3A341_9PEZI|nr:hypothetical protein BD289DRAFT_438361 [Coniella lustricola]
MPSAQNAGQAQAGSFAVETGLSVGKGLRQLQQPGEQQDESENESDGDGDGDNVGQDQDEQDGSTDAHINNGVPSSTSAQPADGSFASPPPPELDETRFRDLSWTAREGGAALAPNGQPWRYPKMRGKTGGSNLLLFKDEIEQRTKSGQGCKAIADVLVARGVETTARAVAGQRIKWGFRQRARRRMTEKGLANIRKAHDEMARRTAAKPPGPAKSARIRARRKTEITRMSTAGMTSAEIAANVEDRGFKLSGGAATVERLRTVWGLTDNSQRSVHNVRNTARSAAMRVQKQQFENIARELGLADADGWVKAKMDEEVAQEARQAYALKLMGDARPKPVNKDLLRRNAVHARFAAMKAAQAQANVGGSMSPPLPQHRQPRPPDGAEAPHQPAPAPGPQVNGHVSSYLSESSPPMAQTIQPSMPVRLVPPGEVLTLLPPHQQQAANSTNANKANSAIPTPMPLPPPSPPPQPKHSSIPSPPLVISPEEATRHRAERRVLQAQQKLAQELSDLLAARADCRPVVGSLTGLPPSLKDIDDARDKMKGWARALLAGDGGDAS